MSSVAMFPSANPYAKTSRGKCDACGYETEITEYNDAKIEFGFRRARYCRVCAWTFASRCHYDPQSIDAVKVLKSIAIATNMILDAIHEAQFGKRR